MAFSLRKWAEEALAQVNPFDGGRTASTVRAQRQAPPPAQTVTAPKPVQQPQQRSFLQSLGGLGKSIVKPIYETADLAIKAPIENARQLTGRVTGNDTAAEAARTRLKQNFDESLPGLVVNPATKAINNSLYNYPRALVRAGNPFSEGDGYERRYNDALRETGSTGDIVKDIVAPGLETGLNALSLGQAGFAGSTFGRTLKEQGVKSATRAVATPVAKTAGYNAAQGAAQELYQDSPNLKRAAQSAATNAAVGTVADLAFGALPATNSYNKAARPVEAPRPTNLRPNEAYTLSDYQDVLSGNVRNPQTQQAIIQDARQAATRNNLDITSGSPVDIQARVNSVLEQPQNAARFEGQSDLRTRIKEAKQRVITPLNEVGAIGNDVRPLVEDTAFSDMRRGISSQNSELRRPQVQQAQQTQPVSDQSLGQSNASPRFDMPFSRVVDPQTLRNSPAVNGGDSLLPDRYPQSLLSTARRLQEPFPTTISQNSFESAYNDTMRGVLAQPQVPRVRDVSVRQPATTKNVPVQSFKRQGDTVTATNVNPNIKRGEKRFSVTDTGELLEDRKGAYRIFTDDDGRVQNVRIGDKVYTSKDYGDLSDVNDYGSTLATMRRNVERGFGKQTGDKLSRFLVDHQQAQATKMIDRQVELNEGIRAVAKDLGINFAGRTKKAKKVSAAIQDFGEGNKTREQLVEEFGQATADKIVQADEWFRSQYDQLLNEMNATLTQYGYDPVPKRENYYTHFQDENLWKKFGLKMQEIKNQLGGPTMQDADPNATRGSISNKLAGESEFTQPNKRFNRFALRRTGDTYTPDAFGAFERYLNPTLNNIYMTPSISRARVVAKAIASEADAVGKDANKILVQTKEWANDLAGKSNRFDRPVIDTKGGQAYLKAARWAQKKAGQNTIVGNLGTAIVQPIVLSQSTGKFGLKNTLVATLQELSTAHGKSSPIRQSEFMRRRYADLNPVTRGKTDTARSWANKPLEIVEETAARITWNAAHNDAIAKGMKDKDAIKYADIETEKTLAGRSIGEKPELFRSKAVGPLTMYQLEVSNFWQQLGKEMTKGQAAKTLVAAWALNGLIEQVSGKQVGFNPIDAAIDSYGITTDNEKGLKDRAIKVGQRFAGEVVDNAPLVAPIANFAVGDNSLRKIVGGESNVGRFGVSSPLSSINPVGNPWNVANLVLPFGGAQLKKSYQGLRSFAEGQLTDKNGKNVADIPQTGVNFAKSALFGKSAVPEVKQYYDGIGKDNAGSGKADSVDEILKAQFSTKEQKKWLELTESEKKELAKTDPQAKEWLRQYEATKRVNKPAPDLPSGLSEASKRVLEWDNKRTQEEKDNLAYSQNDYDFKLSKAKFERDDLEGKVSKAERINREQSLKKAEVGSQFSKDTREIYNSLSKEEVYALAETDENGKQLLEQALAYGDKLVEAGVIKKNKLRTGSKGGSKGGKGGKGNYSTKLYAFGSEPWKSGKSLRQILEEAKVKAPKATKASKRKK